MVSTTPDRVCRHRTALSPSGDRAAPSHTQSQVIRSPRSVNPGPQPEPVAVERVVARIPDVDRLLRQRARPGHRQLAGVGVPAEQVVGYAGTLAARQPGRDETVDLLALCGVDDDRAAGD